jgi:hypothetical protein
MHLATGRLWAAFTAGRTHQRNWTPVQRRCHRSRFASKKLLRRHYAPTGLKFDAALFYGKIVL